MYTNHIDIFLGPYGYLFMITYDNIKLESKIFNAQLRNPVGKIKFLKLVERMANMVQKWTSVLL